MLYGVLKTWCLDDAGEKMYGFIRSHGDHDTFFHVSAVHEDSVRYLKVGNHVEFDAQLDEDKQKYYATTVRRYWPENKGRMFVWYCNQGYGWIKPDTNDPDIFVHYKAFDYEDSPISVGSRVCYGIADGEKGRLQAIRVCVDPFPPPDPDEMLAMNMEAITFTKKRRRLESNDPAVEEHATAERQCAPADEDHATAGEQDAPHVCPE